MNVDTATDTGELHAADSPYLLNPAEAFEQWFATGEGKHRWATSCWQLTVERVCHVLKHTRATRFGLLLSNRGVIIWSRFSPRSYSRLAAQYEEAAAAGICFWWDDQGLRQVETAAFFTLVRTLPAPACPACHPARRPGHLSVCSL